MLVVKTFLAASPIHGLGLFAGQDIAKGQMVYKFEPVFTKRFTRDELRAVRGDVFAYDIIRKHAWRCGDDFVISLDDDRFTNHSVDPNTVAIGDDTFACRDISFGEEITADYDCFYEQGSDFYGVLSWLD